MVLLQGCINLIFSGGDFKTFHLATTFELLWKLYCVSLLWTDLPLQVQKKFEAMVDSITQSQPSIIIKGRIGVGLAEAALVSEGIIVSEFNLSRHSMPLMLLAAFYCFNIHYTEGCSNFYSALEVILMKNPISRPNRKTRLAVVLNRLENSEHIEGTYCRV